jgi:ABC-type antimicrobial peptide transport system permease subunit
MLAAGARTVGLGLAAGLAGALLLTRVLASLLHGVGPRDPLTFAAAPLVIAAVALLAAWLPARRAAKVDPRTVLQES